MTDCTAVENNPYSGSRRSGQILPAASQRLASEDQEIKKRFLNHARCLYLYFLPCPVNCYLSLSLPTGDHRRPARGFLLSPAAGDRGWARPNDSITFAPSIAIPFSLQSILDLDHPLRSPRSLSCRDTFAAGTAIRRSAHSSAVGMESIRESGRISAWSRDRQRERTI